MALKLFEYLACGTSIVASDLPINKEVLIDKQNALLFKADDPNALARAIETVFRNKRLADKISKNALKGSTNYSYENRAKKIVDLLKHIYEQ